MLQQERHERLLTYLNQHDFLSVDQAIGLLGVSPATIRRDFSELAQHRMAKRTRGGLCRVRGALGGFEPFSFREMRFAREKQAIACKAASLIRPGDVVYVDGGTTTFQMAGYISSLPIRCITTSLRMAAVLAELQRGEGTVEVYLTGGYVYPQSGLLIGPQAKAALEQYHADWAFISVAAISEDGVFNANELVVDNERAMISHADRVVILADHSKLDKRSMCRICGYDQVDVVITDGNSPDSATLAYLREQRVQVLVADAAAGDARFSAETERSPHESEVSA